MTRTKKRFQTGREIMRAYVPDYVAPKQIDEDDQKLGIRSGEELAEELLSEFKTRLEKSLRSNAASKSRRKKTRNRASRTAKAAS